MNARLRMLTVALAFVAGGAFAQSSIVDSPHNLSSSGPGVVKATSEDRVCVFCHIPHGSRTNAPLWNRRDSNASYIPYDSPTLVASPGQPTGSSKLCLSCHDGTVGLGDLVSEDMPIPMDGGDFIHSQGALIGTDLRDDHPISFAYADALGGTNNELAPPGSWDPALELDPAGMLQCTTCHDPHNNEWGRFLAMPNEEARMCRECHRIQDFDGTGHESSTNTWNGSGRDPWPHTDYDDVAANACLNCHRSHHAAGNEGLTTSANPSEVCLTCHNGSVADSNVQASFHKTFRHPVETEWHGHRPGETLDGRADHVTCVDCHNPHRAHEEDTTAPEVQGVLTGVSGLTIAGTPIDEAFFEYEVCLKCHAEEGSRTLGGIERQVSSTSILRQIEPGAASSHPIAESDGGNDVPSLIAPLTTDSMIRCSDCHGDNVPAAADGTRAGVHGSQFEFLLRREYQTGDGTAESPTAYALCYSCHDRASILGDESFPAHRKHVVEQNTPCSVCHAAHGVDGLEGNATNNARLINFDVSVVNGLSGTGVLEYRNEGGGTGSCTLTCHGRDHDGQTY